VKLNRRNALLALGTIAAGSGTALATGAFSSVNADRTVTVNVASDAEAVLSLEVNDRYTGLSGGDGDVIRLDFTQINRRARTTFEDALTIGNHGSNDLELRLDIDDDDLDGIIGFSHGSDSFPIDLDEGDELEITITVDTPSDVTDGNSEVTISADRRE